MSEELWKCDAYIDQDKALVLSFSLIELISILPILEMSRHITPPGSYNSGWPTWYQATAYFSTVCSLASTVKLYLMWISWKSIDNSLLHSMFKLFDPVIWLELLKQLPKWLLFVNWTLANIFHQYCFERLKNTLKRFENVVCRMLAILVCGLNAWWPVNIRPILHLDLEVIVIIMEFNSSKADPFVKSLPGRQHTNLIIKYLSADFLSGRQVVTIWIDVGC